MLVLFLDAVKLRTPLRLSRCPCEIILCGIGLMIAHPKRVAVIKAKEKLDQHFSQYTITRIDKDDLRGST